MKDKRDKKTESLPATSLIDKIRNKEIAWEDLPKEAKSCVVVALRKSADTFLNASEIATVLGISERQVRRYLEQHRKECAGMLVNGDSALLVADHLQRVDIVCHGLFKAAKAEGESEKKVKILYMVQKISDELLDRMQSLCYLPYQSGQFPVKQIGDTMKSNNEQSRNKKVKLPERYLYLLEIVHQLSPISRGRIIDTIVNEVVRLEPTQQKSEDIIIEEGKKEGIISQDGKLIDDKDADKS